MCMNVIAACTNYSLKDNAKMANALGEKLSNHNSKGSLYRPKVFFYSPLTSDHPSCSHFLATLCKKLFGTGLPNNRRNSPNISILLNYSCHIVPNTASYKSRIIERLNLKQVSSSDLKRLSCQFRQQEELTC